jgi:hypothetical protein
MTKTEQRVLFLHNLGHLLTFAESEGINVICTDFDRTDEEQRIFVASGKSQKQRSRHQDWLAIDLVVIDEDGDPVWVHHAGDSYERLGAFWEKQHRLCRWGGRWKTLVDAVHFEMIGP